MATRVENFKAKQSLVLSNSFGVINKEKDVELDVTVGIGDDESGYFELYDTLSGGDNWYAEGSIQFDGKNVIGYDGVFDLPDVVKNKLVEMGYNIDDL
jgi:hypothetical protein